MEFNAIKIKYKICIKYKFAYNWVIFYTYEVRIYKTYEKEHIIMGLKKPKSR